MGTWLLLPRASFFPRGAAAAGTAFVGLGALGGRFTAGEERSYICVAI